MPSNIFNAADFTFETLTAVINDQYKPSVLSNARLFKEQGIASTKVLIEQIDGLITLIQSSPRGAPGHPHRTASRKAFEFEAVHLKTSGAVLADSVQNVREFGGMGPTTATQVRDRKLSEMGRNLESTNEWLRMGALKGLILDADGATTLLDLYAFFGISQQVLNIDLTSSSLNVPNRVTEAKRRSEAELGDAKPTSWLAYSSASFLDALRANASIAQTLAGWNAATAMRDDVRGDFQVSKVQFEELRDAVGLTWVEPDTAYLVPLGVDDLFQSHWAPADYNETVNTIGLPLYAKSEPMPMGRGYELEAQSNPIHICRNPRAVIKLVNTTTP